MEAIVYLPEDPSTSWPLKTVMNSYAYKKIHKRQKSDFLSIPTQFKYSPEILCYPRVYEKTKIGSYYLEYAIIPNEDIIKYLIDTYSYEQIDIKDPLKESLTEGFIPKTYRFYPHKAKGEGQFLAILKKTSGVISYPKTINKFSKIR